MPRASAPPGLTNTRADGALRDTNAETRGGRASFGRAGALKIIRDDPIANGVSYRSCHRSPARLLRVGTGRAPAGVKLPSGAAMINLNEQNSGSRENDQSQTSSCRALQTASALVRFLAGSRRSALRPPGGKADVVRCSLRTNARNAGRIDANVSRAWIRQQ